MHTKVGSTNVFKQDHLAHNQQNVKKKVCNGYHKMYKFIQQYSKYYIVLHYNIISKKFKNLNMWSKTI